MGQGQCSATTKKGKQCQNKGWHYPQLGLTLCDLHLTERIIAGGKVHSCYRVPKACLNGRWA